MHCNLFVNGWCWTSYYILAQPVLTEFVWTLGNAGIRPQMNCVISWTLWNANAINKHSMHQYLFLHHNRVCCILPASGKITIKIPWITEHLWVGCVSPQESQGVRRLGYSWTLALHAADPLHLISRSPSQSFSGRTCREISQLQHMQYAARWANG